MIIANQSSSIAPFSLQREKQSNVKQERQDAARAGTSLARAARSGASTAADQLPACSYNIPFNPDTMRSRGEEEEGAHALGRSIRCGAGMIPRGTP